MIQTTVSPILFDGNDLLRILADVNNIDDVVPLSDEDVAEFEASYTPVPISPEREARQRAEFEALRAEWFAYAPDYADIAEYIAQAPATRLYDLFMALRRAGVDVLDLVPCVLDEMAAD